MFVLKSILLKRTVFNQGNQSSTLSQIIMRGNKGVINENITGVPRAGCKPTPHRTHIKVAFSRARSLAAIGR